MAAKSSAGGGNGLDVATTVTQVETGELDAMPNTEIVGDFPLSVHAKAIGETSQSSLLESAADVLEEPAKVDSGDRGDTSVPVSENASVGATEKPDAEADAVVDEETGLQDIANVDSNADSVRPISI